MGPSRPGLGEFFSGRPGESFARSWKSARPVAKWSIFQTLILATHEQQVVGVCTGSVVTYSEFKLVIEIGHQIRFMFIFKGFANAVYNELPENCNRTMKFLHDLEPEDLSSHGINQNTLIYDNGAVSVAAEGVCAIT